MRNEFRYLSIFLNPTLRTLISDIALWFATASKWLYV